MHLQPPSRYLRSSSRLEQRDYEFTTDNDSELIAVYLADKLSQGIPLRDALATSIDDLGRQDIELVLMGGIRDGVDAVKALCLGADAVAFGTSAIIAGGCIACMQCHIGQCVTGIATQDPEHEKRYDPQAESHNIHRFLEGVRWQIAALTHALGYTDFRALNRDDLVALTPEAAEITGLPHEPGVRAKTPELRVRLG